MKKQHLSKVLSADLSKVTCLTSNLNMPLEDHDKMDDTSSHSPNAINPTIPLSVPYTVLSQIENIHIHEQKTEHQAQCGKRLGGYATRPT